MIHVLFACLDAGGKGDKGTQARGFLRNYLQFSCDFGPVPGEDGQSLTFVPLRGFTSITIYLTASNIPV